MQGWGVLTWQGWRRLSAMFSLEAWERETLQDVAVAELNHHFVAPDIFLFRYA